MVKELYALTKPGLIYGNLITVIGGFVLASRGNVNFLLLLATVAGLSLVIASGCVFNNYIDRDIDGVMERTKMRSLVLNTVSVRVAMIYGVCLGLAGFFILFAYTNVLTAIIALIGFFFYVVMYSLWFKRRSVYGTIVGSISGATPPVVGYCAVTNNFDSGALLLFVLLCLWQVPHFFAIAIYRFKDYSAASVPVMPVKRGIYRTKMHMLLYIIAFIFAAVAFSLFGYGGYIYFFTVCILGLCWLFLSIRGFWTTDDSHWARMMFFSSLFVLVSMFVAMAADALIQKF